MATTTDPAEKMTAAPIHEINTRELLLRHLRKNGYKQLKEETLALQVKKEGLLAVARHGRKELIDVRGLPAYFPKTEPKEAQLKKGDLLLHAMQAVAESLFYSFINVGKYFREEKILSALALPDTPRYKQIIERLENYFTDNNLDFKIYLLAENGDVQERNLNQKRNRTAAVSAPVMEQRRALRDVETER